MTADTPEQTIMEVEAPKAVYALCTFRIDIEKWALLPVEAAPTQSPWKGCEAWMICDDDFHYERPSWWCTCGVRGYDSLSRLRAAHRQADTIVAVMRYDPTTSLDDDNEVRAAEATLVAYWISPDLPLRVQAAAVVRGLTAHMCIEYDDLDCMLARYDIIEWREAATDPDDEFRSVGAADGAAPLPRWAGRLGMSRAVLNTRAVRSWSTVVGPALLESFSDAALYASKTTKPILMTIVVAWCAAFIHVYIRTHLTPFAFIDPVLMAAHWLIVAIVAPSVLLLTMSALGLVSLVDAVRRARPLPRRADPIAWAMTVVLPFVFLFAEKVVLVFGMLVVLASANGYPLPSVVGWCLAVMFVLIVVARSAAPLFAIYSRMRELRAQSSWGALADV
ncbi:hypothetical protein [Mycolicibacterium llatzerense]|uniref:hypothetical protein n=1 Tax=Mycolicibacterium llatzerense TaxID=280871 RepID=UPI0021B6BBBD|nr:hypothetical protein [Mycolicibacterium llatzerense]MCT7367317.1 hypothetical protein [Mycolicibacterium llatzerense]